MGMKVGENPTYGVKETQRKQEGVEGDRKHRGRGGVVG